LCARNKDYAPLWEWRALFYDLPSSAKKKFPALSCGEDGT
jgi:hypothetical protein